jgi:hypothetical protein
MMRVMLATLALRKETKERLDKLGAKGDTYDMIVNRLLDEHYQVGNAKPPRPERRPPPEPEVQLRPDHTEKPARRKENR